MCIQLRNMYFLCAIYGHVCKMFIFLHVQCNTYVLYGPEVKVEKCIRKFKLISLLSPDNLNQNPHVHYVTKQCVHQLTQKPACKLNSRSLAGSQWPSDAELRRE